MITLNDAAADYLRHTFKKDELSDLSAVRFSIKGGGCNGFEMLVKIEGARKFDMPARHDNKFVSNGIRILVDSKSLLYLDGMSVDWKEHNLGHKFVYDIPDSKGSCGCGESFAM